MNSVPRKAFLLAAGLGKRLQPLTSAMPKPLIPLWNKPLVAHIITMLKSWGVEEIVVNCHWQAEKLEKHFAETDYGVSIRLSPEEEILGTGGALAPWREYFSDGPFWVVNGDIAASLECKPLVDAFNSQPGLVGACWVTDKKGPRTVELDYKGRITCYRSPDPGIEGTYTFCGVQLLSSAIFDFIPNVTFSTLVDAYEKAMFKNLFVKGVNIPGSYWNDAGTIDRYREIHLETKKLALSGKTGGGLYAPESDILRDKTADFFCVGVASDVAADVSGHKSVVFDGVVINSGSILKNAVVQGGALDGKVYDCCCVRGDFVTDQRVKDAAEALEWDLQQSAFEFLGERGSNRSFWRGYCEDQRAVFVVDMGGRIENRRYASHTRKLTSLFIPVPEVLYISKDLSTLVLEDMGNTSLMDKVKRDPDRTESIYRSVLKEVAVFHRDVTELIKRVGGELEPPFDNDLYGWEHALFEEELLRKRFGYDVIPDDVRAELVGVATELCRGCQVVVHRDLQSSNILFKGRRFAFIDYQGMRFGSPAYDLASLLYDPYVEIDSKLRCRLAAEYVKMLPECPDVTSLFFKGAVQRLVQSLGAFGRLTAKGHKEFADHIMPALQNLLEAADAADLNALGGLVEELIAREQIRVSG